MTTATALRAICGHDSRSVEGCLPCEAADELEAYARALAASKSRGTALERFSEFSGDEETDPIDRLRFFCSQAMSGQDWLDAEPFLEAVEAAAPADTAPVADASDFETAKRVVPGWKRLQEMLADIGYDTSDTAKRHALRALLLMYAIDALKAAPADSAPGDSPFGVLKLAIQKDRDYAWGWQCNLAMAAVDEGVTHEMSNKAAARFMSTVFAVDITKFPEYIAFAEMWLAAADSAPVAWRVWAKGRKFTRGIYENPSAEDREIWKLDGDEVEPLYAAAPRAPAPTPTPTNIKQEIFEAAVVAHGVRFVQKLPRPDIPSLEAIWVGVDKALAAPRDDPAPDADLTDLAHEALSAAASAAHDLAGPQQRKEDKEARRALFDAIDARVPAPDAGTEALRDALGIGLDLATAEAAKARELYGSYPKDGLGRKCVAADADVATIERALAALSAADQSHGEPK